MSMLLSPIAIPSAIFDSTSPIVEDLHCPLCFNRFRREDHLQRHLLSHGFPKFQCDHQGCGMRFHRKDVLKRHQEVHKAHPTKTRRKPRRGILPEGPIQMMFNQEIDSISLATQSSSSAQDGAGSSTAGAGMPLESQQASDPQYMNLIVTQTMTPPDSQLKQPQQQPFEQTSFPMLEEFSPILEPGLPVPMPEQLQLPSPLASYAGVQPSSPGPETILHISINAFRHSVLPRIPYIHTTAFDSPLPTEMEYAMAALGARHIPEIRDSASGLWHQGVDLLRHPPMCEFRRLQCQILLINFAIWRDDDVEMLQWAKKEQQNVLETILAFPPSSSLNVKFESWESWTIAEERKRTIMGFYVISNLMSIFSGQPPVFWSELVKEDLPCDTPLWECTNEWEWSSIIHNHNTNVNFQEACFALLARDTTHNAVYEPTSAFGQLILLCAVAESLNISKRFPTNYTSVEGFQTGDIAAFIPFEGFLETLSIWKDLWWAASDTLWNPQAATHPRIEATTLYAFTVLQLYNYDKFPTLSIEARRAIMETSTEVFTGVSKSGFLEVSSLCSRVFSPLGTRCATAFAQSMDNWMSFIIDYTESGHELSKADETILARVRQAVRRSVCRGYVPKTKMRFDELRDLQIEIAALWSILLES